MGIPFEKTLFILLPCSVTMSGIQVVESKKDGHSGPGQSSSEFKRDLLLFILPAIMVGMVFSFSNFFSIPSLRVVIALMLLLGSIMRIHSATKQSIEDMLCKTMVAKPYLCVMGFIHGLCNMGGIFLALYSSRFPTKESIRANVALGYLLMGLSQLGFMIIFKFEWYDFDFIFLPIVTFVTYVTIGKRLFDRTPDRIYTHAFTIMMLIMGVLLGCQ
jgi:hypothetical protein